MSYPMPNTSREPTFYPMEADGRDYPRPVMPLLAQPDWREWAGRHRSSESAFLRAGESFSAGRYALAEAMRRAGAGPGKSVLLPSFHCRALVEPAMFVGAESRFYPVSADLRPDFEAMTEMMAAGVAPVAMVLTHYFGFPNALAEAEQFSRRHGIVLIEDCAHALYGRQDGRLLGSVGSYAVASLWKFLPVRDGAVLLDKIGTRTVNRTESPSPAAEVKGVVDLIAAWHRRRAWRRKAQPELNMSTLSAEAGRLAGRRIVRASQPGLKEFSPQLAKATALRSSRVLAAIADHDRVMRRRRENYISWLNGIEKTTAARALFPDLPEGVIPYAFPLLLADETKFHLLKLAGIPMWRWEDMAMTHCQTAQSYRLRLLQLPCHQGLSPDELQWMIQTVRTVVTERGR